MSFSNLKKLRMEAGLSQAQLADAAGIHVMLISKIERGVASSANITLKTAVRISRVLNCSPADLLDDDD